MTKRPRKSKEQTAPLPLVLLALSVLFFISAGILSQIGLGKIAVGVVLSATILAFAACATGIHRAEG